MGKWGGWWSHLGLSEGAEGLQDPTEGGPPVLWAEVGQDKEKTHLLFKFLYVQNVCTLLDLHRNWNNLTFTE